ncbi:diacylglycerol kinase [Marinithermus hydrothermalis]|uniref:Diacylglycerol kinase n=1 Tax=Marinithermus hydrothermalis (strain DSM 14884 / JCM 11576 / T1) TaxID=869210 RepID=F2NP67_MARHT|nr:diacylglycerol kinase [Marinithermus hydrothermalis]AEB11868.1 diacylglycerol kinase [Marinithermus hydrothermalis DSM 14884]
MARVPPRPGTHPDPVKGVAESFRYAGEGLRYAWKNQRNFRIEVTLAFAALGGAVWLEVPLIPVLMLILVVLTLELVNTALEAVVDLVQPTYHPVAKAAKDTAAAAVLVASAISAVVGLILFVPPILARLGV